MRSVWLFVACCVALAACDSSGTDLPTPTPTPPGPAPAPQPPPALVPLAVGNYWVFSSTRTSYDIQTGEPGATQANPGTDTLRVTESMVRDGETWYRLVAPQSIGGNALRDFYSGWVANRHDGLYRLYGIDSTELREVAYPASIGEIYSVVPPFLVTDTTGLPTGFHFERTIAVKRTDYPVEIGGTTSEGVLYTGMLSRLFFRSRDYGFPSWTPPLREVYAPGVGFTYLESGYALLRDSEALLNSVYRFTLIDVSLVAAD